MSEYSYSVGLTIVNGYHMHTVVEHRGYSAEVLAHCWTKADAEKIVAALEQVKESSHE